MAFKDFLPQLKDHEAQVVVCETRYWIGQEGVRRDTQLMPAASIVSYRAGLWLLPDQMIGYQLSFIDDADNELSMSWKDSTSSVRSRDDYEAMRRAAYHYVLPHVLARMDRQLATGKMVTVGRCRVTASGIEFETRRRLISTRTCSIPWPRVRSEMRKGMWVLYDAQAPRDRIILDPRVTPNAYAFSEMLGRYA